MNHAIKALAMFTLLAACAGVAQSQAPKWVTGYYPYWWYDAVTPEDVDMGAITHLVLFNASPNPNSSPYLTGTSAVEGGTNLTRILSLAHAKGVKVILSIGGIYGTEASNMRAIANDATKSAVFAKAASDYALSKGIDGLEMDWEFPQAADRTGWNRLNRLIRNELDKWPVRGIYICAAYARTGGATDSYFAYVRDSMLVYFDQINAMTYTMWQGNDQDYRSGFDTPVNAPTQFSGYNGYNLSDEGPLSFVNAGYPASKIGVSISFEGTRFSGVSTMGQKYSAWAFCSSATRSAGSGYASIPTSGRQYDATAQAAWCASGGAVYSFQTEQSVAAIANWTKSNGFGGVMIYDFPAGHDLAQSVPDILLKTVASTIRGNSPPRATGTFTAIPGSLPIGGGPVTLTWTSINAVSASINQGIGVVALAGTQANVSVTATKTFTLTLTDSGGGQSTYPATVTVATPPAPTGTFTASPTTLPAGGGNVTLTWTSVNADTARIDQGIGTVALSGSQANVAVPSTRTFTLTLKNTTGGTKTYTATVTVSTSPAPTGTFTVNPASLPAGGDSVTLSWTSSNATSATINQGVGSVTVPSGSKRVRVAATTTFQLSLSNGSVSQNYTATVTVAVSAPTGTFTVTPDSLPAGGGNVRLTWTSTGATSASINQGIGAVSVNGTRNNVPVTTTKTFVLTLTNSSGSRTYSDTVRVAAANPGAPTGTFTINPLTLPASGGNVTMTWTSSGATSATIDQGIGSVPVTGTRVNVFIDSTTSFELTLTNASGTQSYLSTVTVAPSGSLTLTTSLLPVGGGNVTLSWTSMNATTATIDQGIGDVPPNDSQTFSIVTKTTFIMTLSNSAGTRTYTATVDVDGSNSQPKDYTLEQNFPNPFNPSTRIIFKLPADADVKLTVYNLLGQTIETLVDRRLVAGSYAFSFSSGTLPSGMYYYVIKAGNFTEARRMLLLK